MMDLFCFFFANTSLKVTCLCSTVGGALESRGANMPQQKDIVKIAIQMPGAYPQLIQLDQVGNTLSPSARAPNSVGILCSLVQSFFF